MPGRLIQEIRCPQSSINPSHCRENLSWKVQFCTSFFLSSFPSGITQKVYNVYEWSAHQTTPLLSEIIFFLVRPACELRSTSYGAENMSQTFFYMPFWPYLHTQLITKGHVRRYLFTGLELYARYDRQVMDPNTHRNLFGVTFCAYLHVHS